MSESGQSITEERVLTLLEVYGADPRAWPQEEVEAASNCIAHSHALQQAQASAAQLDILLKTDRNSVQVDKTQVDRLATCILAQLSKRTATIPGTRPGWSQYLRQAFVKPLRATATLAAVAVLTLAVILVRFEQGSGDAVLGAFEKWAWQDVTGQPLDFEEQETTLDFMGLVELEYDADDV